MINCRDISIVVTGKLVLNDSDKGFSTNAVLKSIKETMPEATVILSTWKGEPTEGLAFDCLILNDDPGPLPNKGQNDTHNRQIVTSRSGIAACNTTYCVRMRTDTKLAKPLFLNYFENSQNFFLGKYKLFRKRIVTCSYFSRNPRTSGMLFHPSDLFHFGLTEDLFNLWNADLLFHDQTDYLDNSLLAPEQYLWKNFIYRKTGISFHPFNFTIENIIHSELYFVNNFIPLSPKDIGIYLPNRFLMADAKLNYSFDDWKHLYKNYSSSLSFFRILELSLNAGIFKRTRMYFGNLKRNIFK